MTEPYPLRFASILKEKVWGGRRLARFGKALPEDPNVRIGESWELADLSSTSPSGGGGEAAHSIITNGKLAGKPIGHAVALWRERLLGEALYGRACDEQGVEVPAVPILLKYLDASEHLSVQVHPSPAYAKAHPDAHLKTESWYILDAEPMGDFEPMIFAGLRENVDENTLRQLISEGRAGEALLAHPAVPGQCYTLVSGTVHALGAGVLVAEVQTPSDTTFRLYDWTREYKRAERELHLDQAMACIDFDADPPPEPRSADREAPISPLAETDFYTIDEVRPRGTALPMEDDGCFALMTVAGTGTLRAPGCEPEPIAAGTTLLIPASCARGSTLDGDEHLRVLKIRLLAQPATLGL